MDILTHSLSGAAAATVAAAYSRQSLGKKLGLVLIGAIAGALPDVDAISLWSKFDATIGSVFNLTHNGKEIYFGKFWYSHHAFLHSIVAAILGGLLIILLGLIRKQGWRFWSQGIYLSPHLKLMGITYFFSYNMHLLEDMPTPACVWGGVRYLWPLSSYQGGTGDIWWWNNYDIFLIVVAVLVLNLLVIVFSTLSKGRLFKWALGVFAIGFVLSFYQMKTRGFDFSYDGFTREYNRYEQKSKEIQKEILGDELFDFMEALDNCIPLNF